jgi:hypothetical protein
MREIGMKSELGGVMNTEGSSVKGCRAKEQNKEAGKGRAMELPLASREYSQLSLWALASRT